MVRTIEEHARDIDALVTAALADRPSETLEVTPAAIAMSPHDYLDRVAAVDVIAPIDLPPFDNSQMDGYAVASADLASAGAGGGGATLAVVARIPAGHAPVPLARGTAAPIMTGAAVPAGADAIVQIERATPPTFLPEESDLTVELPGPIEPGLFVRRAGSDVAAGSVLVSAGTRLLPAHWGVLAASGLTTVEVVRRPRVLVVSSGEELAPPGSMLGPGQIHDANGASLAAALTGSGCRVAHARVVDDARALLDVIASHADVDLVVTTGGVSAGAYEVVREAFEPLGVAFGSVAMQPGGPQGWGLLSLVGVRLPTVCFPGNPVSTLVSFEAFLRLPLERAAGRRLPRRDETAPLAVGVDSPPGKAQIRRARLGDDGAVHFVGGPSSHLLHNYAEATVLAHVPLGVSRLEAGDEVVVWRLDD